MISLRNSDALADVARMVVDDDEPDTAEAPVAEAPADA